MLSREWCERLRVLPEVREHDAFAAGERFYIPPRDHLWVNECETPVHVGGEAPVWCPDLAALLAMASAHTQWADQLCLMRAWDPERRVYRWGFTDDAAEDGPGGFSFGDTPEAAVAAWLLAHAEAGR